MKENSELKTIQATLSRQGVEHQCLSAEELKQCFPNVRLARGEVGLLDKSGGVLYADRALRALQVIRTTCGARWPTRAFTLLGLFWTFGARHFIYAARPCHYGTGGLESVLSVPPEVRDSCSPG